MTGNFVIIGAGQAGAWVARTLRTSGFDGRIVLIGDEPHAPYERPSLSKAALRDGYDAASATLLSAVDASELDIDLRLGDTAIAIDRAARTVRCASGAVLPYERLFLTMGARPRTLPGIAEPWPNSHLLRTIDDAARLGTAMRPSARLAIVGGGWIGLEVAATAQARGMEVTVLERDDRLCLRSAPPVLSDYLAALHSSHGVKCRTGAAIAAIEPLGERIAIHTGDAQPLVVDHMLVAIGIVPNDSLARECGLLVRDGVIVDAAGRTSDPAIFAAGDLAAQPCALSGAPRRRESWANAQNQAIVVAKAALGEDVVYDEVPWLWSDQFDRNIQIVGHPECGTRAIARGAPQDGVGSWLLTDNDGTFCGAISVNAPADIRPVRAALRSGVRFSEEDWADTSVPARALR